MLPQAEAALREAGSSCVAACLARGGSPLVYARSEAMRALLCAHGFSPSDRVGKRRREVREYWAYSDSIWRRSVQVLAK